MPLGSGYIFKVNLDGTIEIVPEATHWRVGSWYYKQEWRAKKKAAEQKAEWDQRQQWAKHDPEFRPATREPIYAIYSRIGSGEDAQWLTEDGWRCEVVEGLDSKGRLCLQELGHPEVWIVWEVEAEKFHGEDAGPATYHCYWPTIPDYEIQKLRAGGAI